jgi:hypothetical protein
MYCHKSIYMAIGTISSYYFWYRHLKCEVIFWASAMDSHKYIPQLTMFLPGVLDFFLTDTVLDIYMLINH